MDILRLRTFTRTLTKIEKLRFPNSGVLSSFPCSHFLGLSVSHSYVRIFFNANSFLSFSNYSPNAMGPTSEMKFKPYLSLR